LSAVKGAPGRARWYLLFHLSRDQHSEFCSSLLEPPMIYSLNKSAVYALQPLAIISIFQSFNAQDTSRQVLHPSVSLPYVLFFSVYLTIQAWAFHKNPVVQDRLPVFLCFFPVLTTLLWAVDTGGAGSDVRTIFSRTQ
jgi:hypothetical protein